MRTLVVNGRQLDDVSPVTPRLNTSPINLAAQASGGRSASVNARTDDTRAAAASAIEDIDVAIAEINSLVVAGPPAAQLTLRKGAARRADPRGGPPAKRSRYRGGQHRSVLLHYGVLIRSAIRRLRAAGWGAAHGSVHLCGRRVGRDVSLVIFAARSWNDGEEAQQR